MHSNNAIHLTPLFDKSNFVSSTHLIVVLVLELNKMKDAIMTNTSPPKIIPMAGPTKLKQK
jgi:hypothetical protein